MDSRRQTHTGRGAQQWQHAAAEATRLPHQRAAAWRRRCSRRLVEQVLHAGLGIADLGALPPAAPAKQAGDGQGGRGCGGHAREVLPSKRGARSTATAAVHLGGSAAPAEPACFAALLDCLQRGARPRGREGGPAAAEVSQSGGAACLGFLTAPPDCSCSLALFTPSSSSLLLFRATRWSRCSSKDVIAPLLGLCPDISTLYMRRSRIIGYWVECAAA